MPTDAPQFAIDICDRRFGVGADGLLIVDADASSPTLRMFNPDGTEDFCGNGLRCAALHLWNGQEGGKITLLHAGLVVPITFASAGWIDVELPQTSFAPADVPLRSGEHEIFDAPITVAETTVRASAVTTGSTHCVIECLEPPEDDFFLKISRSLEHDPRFPLRTSVIWAWPIGDKQFQIRIWERGAGETCGCGTGSGAVAAVQFRKNPGLLAVGIKNPGGDTVVARGASGAVVVSARARKVFEALTLDARFEKEGGEKAPVNA